jgi:hypothetical protein
MSPQDRLPKSGTPKIVSMSKEIIKPLATYSPQQK